MKKEQITVQQHKPYIPKDDQWFCSNDIKQLKINELQGELKHRDASSKRMSKENKPQLITHLAEILAKRNINILVVETQFVPQYISQTDELFIQSQSLLPSLNMSKLRVELNARNINHNSNMNKKNLQDLLSKYFEANQTV